MHSIVERVDAIYALITAVKDKAELENIVNPELEFLIETLSLVPLRESVYEKIIQIFIHGGVVADDAPCERIIGALAHSVPSQGLSEHVLDLVSEFLLEAKAEFVSPHLISLSKYLLSNCHNQGRLNVLMMIKGKKLDVGESKVDPVVVATHVAQFLTHPNSRIRLSALGAMDGIMRWRSWKTTYPILCVLLGRQEEVNVVHLGEFYDENFCRKNFIACLMFDCNPQVRLALFRTLLGWTTTLEDKADIESHLLPFILIGELDVDIGAQFTEEFHKLHPDAIGYVQRYARKFIRALLGRIDCDFATITNDNRDRLLIHTVKYIGPTFIVEFISDLLLFIEKRGVKGMEAILDIIAESNVESFDHIVTSRSRNTIEMCTYLLQQGNGNVGEKVRRWFLENNVETE